MNSFKNNYRQGAFDISQRVNHPTEKVVSGKRIFVVDSRQRDCSIYPNPNNYRIPIGQVYKNITSIELKGVILPKTSYNVHGTNKYIDFNIGDSVTNIQVVNGGARYTSIPTVTITSPPNPGVNATAVAVLAPNGTISSINIVIPGSGYIQSNPPSIIIDPPPNTNGATQATAKSTVGTSYTATLRRGNYTIGGNTPTGLILEIQNAMNFAVNGGVYDPASVSPFRVVLVSQYPELNATPGTPEAFDTNATQFNRIQIVNVNSSPWELLWCSGLNNLNSSRKLLGFRYTDESSPTIVPAVGPIPAGTAYRGLFDYDLHDFPDYVVLSFWAITDDTFERVESVPGFGLNRAFATLAFDGNTPDNLFDLGGSTTTTIGDVEYLTGEIEKGNFYRTPGFMKPLKGYDFDNKYLEFNPAIGKLSYLNIKFTQFGTDMGLPNLYDFEGRDHFLIFEFGATDTRTGKRF